MRMTPYEYNPAPPGRFILSSYIPNIRPQIDLNLFMSILKYLMELSFSLLSCAKILTRRDVIIWIRVKSP